MKCAVTAGIRFCYDTGWCMWQDGSSISSNALKVIDPVNGVCPAGSLMLFTNDEGAFVASASSSVQGIQTSVTSLQSRVTTLEAGSGGSSGAPSAPFDPAEGSQVFALTLGVPILIFVLARGLGTILNLVRKA